MAGGSGSKKRSRRKRKRERERKPNPATQLTDDLLVEILARVPYRSLCRFRCVSTRWRAVISHPDYQRRLPQTLAGFFHSRPIALNGGSSSESRPVRYCFTNVSGTGRPPNPPIDPSFRFLPDREREHLTLVDCCNGLILCHNISYTYTAKEDYLVANPAKDKFDYLVVNPATEEWVVVPVSWRGWSPVHTVHLGFDPAFSSHFYIFEFQFDVEDNAGVGHDVVVVKIYSSETGVWCHKKSAWGFGIEPQFDLKKSVFVNGMLYVITFQCVIGAVDVKGETWRIIDFPRCEDSLFLGGAPGFIDLSQGRLHLANDDNMVGDKLAIWVLDDKDTDEWILKHIICYKHLLGREYVRDFGMHEFIVVAIHPYCNIVFFVFGHDEKTLMSYDMDSGRVHFIHDLGNIIDFECFRPYVPLFSKSLPDAAKR